MLVVETIAAIRRKHFSQGTLARIPDEKINRIDELLPWKARQRRHRLAPNRVIQITAGNCSRLLHMLVHPSEASEKISPPSHIQDRRRIRKPITER